jgi:hypothetical protein
MIWANNSVLNHFGRRSRVGYWKSGRYDGSVETTETENSICSNLRAKMLNRAVDYVQLAEPFSSILQAIFSIFRMILTPKRQSIRK